MRYISVNSFIIIIIIIIIITLEYIGAQRLHLFPQKCMKLVFLFVIIKFF